MVMVTFLMSLLSIRLDPYKSVSPINGVRVIRCIWVSMLILGCISISSFNSDGEGVNPAPIHGDWVITNNTSVKDETIVLNGNLTIWNDVTLSMDNVTLIINITSDSNPGNSQYRIKVEKGAEYCTIIGNSSELQNALLNLAINASHVPTKQIPELEKKGWYIKKLSS